MEEKHEPRLKKSEVKGPIVDQRILSEHYKEEEERSWTGTWEYYDEPLESFNVDFYDVLKKDAGSIQAYLKKFFPNGSLRGAEFGGPASELFQALRKEGVINESVGFALTDMRSQERREKDARGNHAVVEANILSAPFTGITGKKYAGINAIRKWVQRHGKFHFIIERMAGPNQRMTKYRFRKFLLANVLRWYSFLEKDGVMLLELPYVFPAPEFEKILKESGFFDATVRFINNNVWALKIRRLPGSPDSLRSLFKNYLP